MFDQKNFKVEALNYDPESEDMVVVGSLITRSRNDAMNWAFRQMQLGYWTALYLTDEREQKNG